MNEHEYRDLMKRDPSAGAFIQRMEGSWRNRPYYRATPRHILDPTPAVLKARLAFTRSAYSGYGDKGPREVNGVMMPPVCKRVQDSMKGHRFSRLTIRQKRVRSTIRKVNRLRPTTELGKVLERTARALRALESWGY